MNRDFHQLNSQLLDDRFEQLSAFIDGELSEIEQAEVQHWLASDPDARSQYRQLVQLQSGFSRLSVPESARSSGETTAEQVLERLAQPRWLPEPNAGWVKFSRRYAPIAAGAIAAFTGWAAWDLSHPTEPLVSLEEPPVVIPTLVSESPAMQEAGTYLLAPNGDRDPYSILFDDDSAPQWQ
ncbi:MAG: hypothetical protein AAFY15_01715 [Cyanobacteria bacterium J06648_11]